MKQKALLSISKGISKGFQLPEIVLKSRVVLMISLYSHFIPFMIKFFLYANGKLNFFSYLGFLS